MATWPASGNTDWNTKMLAYLAVGHNTDGTHNQEDSTPSSYAGEESVTFPNGLIFKHGEESVVTDTTDDVAYETAFPNAFVTAMVCFKGGTITSENHNCYVQPKSGSETTILQITNDASTITIYWQAWGY